MDYWIYLATAAVIIYTTYYFLFRGLNYFKKHGVIHFKPKPLFGDMLPMMMGRESLGHIMQRVYNLHPEAKYVGMFDFMTPIILLRDPELMKAIAIKHFDSFPDHRSFVDEKLEPFFGNNLFSLRGDKWRDVRNLLSPAFTSSKLKSMFELMSKCAGNFADHIVRLPEEQKSMNAKDYFTRYTNDVIASCAFGLTVDTMRNPENTFYLNGKEVTDFSSKLNALKFFLIRSSPVVCSYLGLKLIPTRIERFFTEAIAGTIKVRDEQGIRRPDMIQLMMDARGKPDLGKELSVSEMTSQAFIFFFGGFDTVSRSMCFAAHHIAVDPEIQSRLQAEVDAVLEENEGRFTYDAVMKMEYMDAVVNEVLRMYPAGIFLDRVCTKEYELPPALPGGKPLKVEKGTNIWFPVFPMHRDPKYFEDPTTFKPERFLDEGRSLLNSSIYMPFGLGPRICIGLRFSLVEIKIVLCHLLARCNFKPCANTQVPLKLSTVGFDMAAEGGYWLKFEPRIDARLANGKQAS